MNINIYIYIYTHLYIIIYIYIYILCHVYRLLDPRRAAGWSWTSFGTSSAWLYYRNRSFRQAAQAAQGEEFWMFFCSMVFMVYPQNPRLVHFREIEFFLDFRVPFGPKMHQEYLNCVFWKPQKPSCTPAMAWLMWLKGLHGSMFCNLGPHRWLSWFMSKK